ncbi:hypothetical protein CCB80_01105 [Armatimonadetes bacterium Uphvl-Ar1]|nr:hypothetical protein CCB80_01105 [Armatimonadetes bacterium Uphvl-Ar1]
MGVTNYFSVDGEVIAESGAAGYLSYHRDNLGSVCATLDSSGALVHQYQYKPFGELWSASGVGAQDRRLQWCGSWGYSAIALTRKFLSYYVRARHYAAILGNWTSVDPLWPSEMAYGYVENRVMTGVDYWGMRNSVKGKVQKNNGCQVYYCTILTGKLFHSFACVDGPNGGCAGEIFPSFWGGHVYNAYGKPQMRCKEIPGASCELKSSGDCTYAARVCFELKKPKTDVNYWGEGMCHFYAVGALCDACEAYRYGGRSHEKCVCEQCGQGDMGGMRIGISSTGDSYVCGAADSSKARIYDPTVARKY